jgi:hypothetical protein
MLSRDDFAASRDQLMARREELMQRADEMRERFADSVDQDLVVNAAGLTLVSAGISLGLTQWVRGRRSAVALILPVALLIAGLGVLGGGFARRRGVSISDAEEAVRAQLAALDPVARFHVLRDVNRDAMPFVRHSHN